MGRSSIASRFAAPITRLAPLLVFMASATCGDAAGVQPRAPEQPVRLVFVHHSCGENWLADEHGGLGRALDRNNYFVSDTNYGWGPDGIGDRTDIVDWPEWFTGPASRRIFAALLRESGTHSPYTRTLADPGGENRIILFKSCFPNSNLEGSPSAAPARGDGLTVANAKAIYDELLGFFATRPDLLFVAITAPPVQDPTHARNARAFNDWLATEWLANYAGANVAVFDFYNVLTAPGNHHWVRDGKVERVTGGGNTLHYPSDGDDHPSPAGNRKATAEFVPLLNVYYQRWRETAPAAPPAVAEEPEPTGEPASLEPAPVEPTPEDAPPAVLPSGDVLADFESGTAAWQTFSDGAEATRVELTLDQTSPRGGKACARITYDLGPEAWGTCSLIFPAHQDWSGKRGVSFYIHSEQVGQEVVFIAYTGASADALEHFEHAFKTGAAAASGWQRIDVTWDQLKQPEWQGDTDAPFDPSRALGIAFGFHVPESGRSAGTFGVDDISLN